VNPYLLSLVLGVVEGLTEFLPVSSTAHLRITEALLGHLTGQTGILEDSFWKMYTIVIQLGAILCLPIYFRSRIIKFLKTFPKGESGDRTALTHPLTLVIVAFVVTAGPAFLLSKVIGKNLESLKVMGAALLVGGIIMWTVDYFFGWVQRPSTSTPRGFEVVANQSVPAIAEIADPTARKPLFARTERMEEMTWWQAVCIGAAQILSAVFPGTSRSMSTIAAGQVAGMSRPAALEFSFFLSMPTMIVATAYDFLKTVVLKKHAPGETLAPVHMDTQRWIILAIGFVVSFFVAWGVVAWFMNWVRSRGFAPFAIYRIIVGVAVLVWAFKGA
jgi:undecaprenyl-diphosphatase